MFLVFYRLKFIRQWSRIVRHVSNSTQTDKITVAPEDMRQLRSRNLHVSRDRKCRAMRLHLRRTAVQGGNKKDRSYSIEVRD